MKYTENNRTCTVKVLISILAAVLALLVSIGVGSVYISPAQSCSIFMNKLFGVSLADGIEANTVSIFWEIRVPRVLTAFLVGAALSVSGTVMQSVLQNPLASSYTLGVSSGASVGAAIIIVSGFSLPLIGSLTLPLTAFVFGLATVLLAIGFSERLDRNMHNQTIILVGMVLSLFVNAILTLISAMFKQHIQQLTVWTMGSFSSRTWYHVSVLFPVCLIGTVLLTLYSREMDILTFGDEQAMTIGVDTHKVKMTLLVISAAMTGTAVCFAGVIGFIDLIAPHVVRRIFGPAHRVTIPMAAVFGGSFMVVADLISRTIAAPVEVPVGAVTALIGAPFFMYIFFHKDPAEK